jgi:hypothetical protein
MRVSAISKANCFFNPMAWTRDASRALRRLRPLFAFAAASLAVPLLLAPLTRAHAAGGAFFVDDSEIAKVGDCKVESFLQSASNHDFVGSTNPACVFNVFQPVELGAQLLRVRFDHVWDTALTFKAKTNMISTDKGGFGLALSGGTAIDLVTGDYLGSFVNVPVSLKVNKDWQINLNVGGLYDSPNNLLWLTWGAGFEWIFAPKFTLLGEVFGLLGHGNTLNSSQSDPRAQLGLRYTPIDTIDIDVIYGRNIYGVDTNWITLGLNVRFTPGFTSK